jgi:signal transduction histidine kinase
MHLSGAQFWIEKWGVTGLQLEGEERLQFPLVFEEVTRGLWVVGARADGQPFSPEDINLLEAVAKKAEVALAAVLTIERLTRQLDEIRSSRETLAQSQRMLFHTREEERARLARDLHDGPIQTLISMNLQLGMVIPAEEPGQAEEDTPEIETLKQLRRQIRDLLAELRQVIAELRPPVLDTLGLGAALRILTEEWSAQQKVRVNLVLPETTMRALPAEASVSLYRVVQEALANIARHACAHDVLIHLSWEAAHLSLMIRDDGQGFDMPSTMNHLTSEGHFGLVGIQERVQAIGGTFKVASAPGQGTTLLVDWQMKTPTQKFL